VAPLRHVDPHHHHAGLDRKPTVRFTRHGTALLVARAKDLTTFDSAAWDSPATSSRLRSPGQSAYSTLPRCAGIRTTLCFWVTPQVPSGLAARPTGGRLPGLGRLPCSTCSLEAPRSYLTFTTARASENSPASSR
jgi:hypothetical protein